MELKEWSAGSDLVRSTTTKEGAQRLEALLANYKKGSRPLPGASERPANCISRINLAHLAREARCKMDVVQRVARGAVEETAEEVGIDDDTYLRTPMACKLEGRPWLDRLRYKDVPKMLTLLSTAAYILIAFYSGMRDSEIKHLRKGCLTAVRDSAGEPIRYLLTSLAFKGENNIAGVSATWVVSEEVAHAVKVLETIQSPEAEFLFAPSLLPLAGRRHTKASHGAMTVHQTNRELNRFVAWVNEYCGAQGHTGFIPQDNGRVWRLATQQFRRTLAWFIARRPGGSIAGAIQFRHRSIQMFEGYAGTSKSGFRPEVEGEKAMARGHYLLEQADKNEHGSVFSGPASAEAASRVQEFANLARFDGLVADNERQLKKLVSRHEPNVYLGEMVTCVFNPEKALCLRESGGKTPNPAGCVPLGCRNVALDADQRSSWINEQRQLEKTLEAPVAQNPYVRAIMQQQIEKIATLLKSSGLVANDSL